jgi:hypothetical protein
MMKVPRSVIHGKSPHEHRLLADLACLPVDERDGQRERARVGQVLLAALLDGRDGIVEPQLPEVHGEVARVVLDGRDVVDRLPQAALLRIGEPFEGSTLDVDQVREVMDSIQARETAAHPWSVKRRQDSGSSGRGGEISEAYNGPVRGLAKIAERSVTPAGAVDSHGPRSRNTAHVARHRVVDWSGCDYRPTRWIVGERRRMRHRAGRVPENAGSTGRGRRRRW